MGVGAGPSVGSSRVMVCAGIGEAMLWLGIGLVGWAIFMGKRGSLPKASESREGETDGELHLDIFLDVGLFLADKGGIV